MEQFKGTKSIVCACGTKTALVEKPTAYQAQFVQKGNPIYKLVDTRYVQ